jgi:hypothetical protein
MNESLFASFSTEKEESFLTSLLAILAGALLLAWPALVNGFPIVFSDTHAFLVQGGEPQMVWDKPFVYGPVLAILHRGWTLWLPLAAQVLVVSHLLCLVRGAFAAPGWRFHLAVCAGLAGLSAAPWFASLLMPDILAPVVVLVLFLLGFAATGRWMRMWLVGLGGFAIASHLSYLPLAGVVTVGALVLGGRRIVAVPLGVALAVLLAGNAIGHGRFGISPYGSVFALARLVTDGPAQAVLARECPGAGWKMCGWQGRFPDDSDLFLWKEWGPVWSTGGPMALAPEASAIVRATLVQEPVAVLRSALGNFWEQIRRVRLGDTLGNDWLEGSITGSFAAYFPAGEMARFRAGRQMQETLREVAAPLNTVQAVVLAAGAAASLVVAWRRRGTLPGRFALLVLAGVLANAAASGALSRPHDRYQARIAWLVLLPVVVGWRKEESSFCEQKEAKKLHSWHPDKPGEAGTLAKE